MQTLPGDCSVCARERRTVWRTGNGRARHRWRSRWYWLSPWITVEAFAGGDLVGGGQVVGASLGLHLRAFDRGW